MRVYFTFEPRENLSKSLVEQFPEVTFIFHSQLNNDELKQADILVTYGEDVTEDAIAIAERLQWIFVASAGVEKMPAKAITERGIYVSNVKGIHKKPMTESILAHLLAYKRALPVIYKNQEKKNWQRRSRVTELNGSTAIIVGPGAIGGEIGRLLQAFEVHTIGLNSKGQDAEFMDETYAIADMLQHLPKADIVISMLPSTVKTKYIFKDEHFDAMKNSAIFMNFGRGDAVATDVIIRALTENKIEHAVLDVYEEEPLPADSPLWQLENLVVSPHCSSHSSRYVERSLEIFKPSLEKWLAGERKLENEVELMRGY